MLLRMGGGGVLRKNIFSLSTKNKMTIFWAELSWTKLNGAACCMESEQHSCSMSFLVFRVACMTFLLPCWIFTVARVSQLVCDAFWLLHFKHRMHSININWCTDTFAPDHFPIWLVMCIYKYASKWWNGIFAVVRSPVLQ